MAYPGSRYRARIWFFVPAVSSEGTLDIRPVLLLTVSQDNAGQTRVSDKVVCISWFSVDVLHMKAAELKRTGILQGLSEQLRRTRRCEMKWHPIMKSYYQG
jgi:hypothetical protein